MERMPASVASRATHAVLLLGIVLLGLGLRLNNLPSESVYWDEFSSLIHLKPPAGYTDSPWFPLWDHTVIRNEVKSLPEFWQRNRELDPATMPLYYTFEYLVWEASGQSVPVLRLLSVFFSVLAFPFIYLLGRALWGPTAGLVALFLFAASPIHVQFAQEIRMYSLFGALAAASAYTFVKLLDARTARWWVANFACNILLLWTHPFAVWLPFVEGLTLLLCYWHRPRLVLGWGFGHVALLLPSAWYISTIQFFGEDTTSDWLNIPGWRILLADIFADDMIGLTPQLFGRPDFLARFLPESTAQWLASSNRLIGVLGALFFIALSGLCAWRALKRSNADASPHAADRWRKLVFLLLWALLPPLILITLSYMWRPMIFPRYTLHCSIAFYLLAAGGIAALPSRALRLVPIGLLVALYAYQNALVVQGPHRTDWNGASAYLKENAADQDLILVENWLWKRVFTYSMGPVPQPIGYAADFGALAEQARTWLDGAQPDPGAETRPGVWVVVQNGYFNMAPAFELENALTARGMRWESRYFVGIEGLWIYRVLEDPLRIYQASGPLHEEFAKSFHDLSNLLWFHGDYWNAICIADRGLDFVPNDSRTWAYKAMSYKELGLFREAANAFEQALRLNRYDYPWSLTNLGECYLELGRPVTALRHLDEALEQLPTDTRPRWLKAEALIQLKRPYEAVLVLNEKLDTQYWEDNHWRVLTLAQQECARLAGDTP